MRYHLRWKHRDLDRPGPRIDTIEVLSSGVLHVGVAHDQFVDGSTSVSYTHLTLPTIYSV